MSDRSDVNQELADEVAVQLSAMLKKTEAKQIESQIQSVPITPITKPKASKYRVGVMETPIKANEISRLEGAPEADGRKEDGRMLIVREVRRWTDHFYSILESKCLPADPPAVC